jgi:hypothetical protein
MAKKGPAFAFAGPIIHHRLSPKELIASAVD